MRSTSIVVAAAALLAGVSAAAAWWIPRHVVTDDTSRLFDAGVSQALARERAGRVTALRYDVHLDIPAIASAPINGRLVATFELDDASRPLAFDFAQPADHLRHLDVNDEAVEPDLLRGHVVIPPRRLRTGRNVVAFDVIAGNEPLNRHDDFLYSLFVPARASLAMPVFDQPDLKARWRLSLDVPKDWVAVSNGRQSGRVDHGDRASLIFDETRPISTYLFAFAAGRFSIETAERNGRTFRMSIARPTRRSWRAIATRSSTSTRRPSPGWRRTRASPIRSTSSTSSSFRRFSSAGWNIPAPSSTTPAPC